MAMLPAQKIQEVIDARIAELLAEQVYARLKNDLQEQWDRVVYELANTRKSNEHLKESVGDLMQYNSRLRELVEHLETQAKIAEENQRKASEILRVATKELGLSE